MNHTPVVSMYAPYEAELRAFGKHWIGPKEYRHGVQELVALLETSPANGDGQAVHVYCWAMPARFYSIVGEPSVDSLGQPQPGFKVSFGSSQVELVARIAIAIAGGMLGFEALTDPPAVKS